MERIRCSPGSSGSSAVLQGAVLYVGDKLIRFYRFFFIILFLYETYAIQTYSNIFSRVATKINLFIYWFLILSSCTFQCRYIMYQEDIHSYSDAPRSRTNEELRTSETCVPVLCCNPKRDPHRNSVERCVDHHDHGQQSTPFQTSPFGRHSCWQIMPCCSLCPRWVLWISGADYRRCVNLFGIVVVSTQGFTYFMY